MLKRQMSDALSVSFAWNAGDIMYARIRNLREDKDLTQRQMADYLHCSQRIYSNYERGDVDVPTDVLVKLANFHNTSVDFILERTDNPNPYPARNEES